MQGIYTALTEIETIDSAANIKATLSFTILLSTYKLYKISSVSPRSFLDTFLL